MCPRQSQSVPVYTCQAGIIFNRPRSSQKLSGRVDHEPPPTPCRQLSKQTWAGPWLTLTNVAEVTMCHFWLCTFKGPALSASSFLECLLRGALSHWNKWTTPAGDPWDYTEKRSSYPSISMKPPDATIPAPKTLTTRAPRKPRTALQPSKEHDRRVVIWSHKTWVACCTFLWESRGRL